MLDLGCGTGQITLPLAKYVEGAIGLDSEEEMLKEAEREAEKINVKNVKWVCDKAENISRALGIFRLITMGKSFHWMNQKTIKQDSLHEVVCKKS